MIDRAIRFGLGTLFIRYFSLYPRPRGRELRNGGLRSYKPTKMQPTLENVERRLGEGGEGVGVADLERQFEMDL